MAQTFTLNSGLTVVELLNPLAHQDDWRYSAIPDHADYLSDAEVQAIHEIANHLLRSDAQVASTLNVSGRHLRVSLPDCTPKYDSLPEVVCYSTGLVTFG